MEERAFREAIHRMVNLEGHVHLTREDVAQRLGLSPDEAEQRLDEMVTSGELELDSDDHGNLFYFSPERDGGGVFAGHLDAKIKAPHSPRQASSRQEVRGDETPLPSERQQPNAGYYPPPGYGAPPNDPRHPSFGAPGQPQPPGGWRQAPHDPRFSQGYDPRVPQPHAPGWYGAQGPGAPQPRHPYGHQGAPYPAPPYPGAPYGEAPAPGFGPQGQTPQRPVQAPYGNAQPPGYPHLPYGQQPGYDWQAQAWGPPQPNANLPVPYRDQLPAGYEPYDPERRSPTAALLLSFFPGAGQLYNGEIGKAFFFFFLTTFLYSLFPFSFLGLIPHAISAADAHATARRSNYGMLPP